MLTTELPQAKRVLLACADNRYENTPIQMYWKFHLQKLKIFR